MLKLDLPAEFQFQLSSLDTGFLCQIRTVSKYNKKRNFDKQLSYKAASNISHYVHSVQFHILKFPMNALVTEDK